MGALLRPPIQLEGERVEWLVHCRAGIERALTTRTTKRGADKVWDLDAAVSNLGVDLVWGIGL